MGKKCHLLNWMPNVRRRPLQRCKTVFFYPIWTYFINFCEIQWGLYLNTVIATLAYFYLLHHRPPSPQASLPRKIHQTWFNDTPWIFNTPCASLFFLFWFELEPFPFASLIFTFHRRKLQNMFWSFSAFDQKILFVSKED